MHCFPFKSKAAECEGISNTLLFDLSYIHIYMYIYMFVFNVNSSPFLLKQT
jgi:hypothetical protein